MLELGNLALQYVCALDEIVVFVYFFFQLLNAVLCQLIAGYDTE